MKATDFNFKGKCLKQDTPYESRFPLYLWQVSCYYYETAKSRRKKGYKLIYAETYSEAVYKADLWAPLIISVRRIQH
jgi:hypothetical protein